MTLSADELLNGRKGQKARKAKNFCLKYWLMAVWHKRKSRKKQKNWELKETLQKCKDGTRNRFVKRGKSVVLDVIVRVEKEDGR